MTPDLAQSAGRRLAGRLRVRFFGIDPDDVVLDNPEFVGSDAVRRDRVTGAAGALVEGYELGLREQRAEPLVDVVHVHDDRLLPFRYEGAAMALALVDALPVPGRLRWARLYLRAGQRFGHLLGCGAGWAAAASGLPAPHALVVDPTLTRSTWNGAGFHDRLFELDRPPADHADALAYRVGSGRALWFLSGAQPVVVSDLVGRSPPEDRWALWTGVGFAACFVGGALPEELVTLRCLGDGFTGALETGAARAAEVSGRTALFRPDVDAAVALLRPGRPPPPQTPGPATRSTQYVNR